MLESLKQFRFSPEKLTNLSPERLIENTLKNTHFQPKTSVIIDTKKVKQTQTKCITRMLRYFQFSLQVSFSVAIMLQHELQLADSISKNV